jgi:hypothetical protein
MGGYRASALKTARAELFMVNSLYISTLGREARFVPVPSAGAHGAGGVESAGCMVAIIAWVMYGHGMSSS